MHLHKLLTQRKPYACTAGSNGLLRLVKPFEDKFLLFRIRANASKIKIAKKG
jgi:hypothetical protein